MCRRVSLMNHPTRRAHPHGSKLMFALLLCLGAATANDNIPDYRHEWLTPPARQQCHSSGFWNNATGLSMEPFNQSKVANAGECCEFCNDQTRAHCASWTYRPDEGICYVSGTITPHPANGAIAGVGLGTPPPQPTARLPPPTPPLGFMPNFVFILTDDQDRILGKEGYTPLGSLDVMPVVKQRLMDEGSLVENFMVNTPICCPSRTEFFTGRYFHNVGPPGDTKGTCMHADTTLAGDANTGLFGLMEGIGYNVGVFGKVTNDQSRILKQMTDQKNPNLYIDSPLDYNDYMGNRYYRYYPNNQSVSTETLDANDPIFGTAYQTTQIGNRTLRWLSDAIEASKKGGGASSEGSARKPFFAYVGPHAPHFPAQPAPWYEHAFDDVDAPMTPNYNLSSPDKAQHVAQNPPLSQRARCWENQHFRDRWSSLLSVDDIVRDVYDALEKEGVLDNTFILYSSDHGYKQGQWRIGTSKEHPYETDVRVPFLMRGPGVKAGGNYSSQLSGNIDVLPTMLHLAAGEAFVKAVNPDGRSMAKFLVDGLGSESDPVWRDYFLNEYLSVGTYYNDHSSCWEDGNTTTVRCGGEMPRSPEGVKPSDVCVESSGVGDGNCYFVDSTHSNSWRQLRIHNASMNWNYVEYDPDWKFNVTDRTGAGLQHYELYDIAEDPYQMRNLYDRTPSAVRASLHSQLAEYFACRGETCP